MGTGWMGPRQGAMYRVVALVRYAAPNDAVIPSDGAKRLNRGICGAGGLPEGHYPSSRRYPTDLSIRARRALTRDDRRRRLHHAPMLQCEAWHPSLDPTC